MPEFAIIIPTYNSAPTLLKLLGTLAEQTDPDFDTIVVDDASTDETEEIVGMFDARYKRLPQNSGPATARNRGAELTDAPWLIFADADTEFQPETVAEIRRVLNSCDADALVGTYSGEPANAGFVPRYKGLWEYATIDLGLKLDDRGLCKITSWAPRPGVVRRTAFEKLGGFDTRFRGADLEDMEFGYRLSKAGYVTYFAPAVRIRHNYPGTAWKELRAFARRVTLWMRMQRSRRELDTTGEGSGESATAHLVGFAAFWCFIAAILFPIAFTAGIALAAYFGWLNRRFLGLSLRNAGLIFTIGAFFYCWVHSVVLGFAAAYGLLTPSRQ